MPGSGDGFSMLLASVYYQGVLDATQLFEARFGVVIPPPEAS